MEQQKEKFIRLKSDRTPRLPKSPVVVQEKWNSQKIHIWHAFGCRRDRRSVLDISWLPYFHLAFAHYTTGSDIILNRTSDSIGKNKSDTRHTNHNTAHLYSIPHATAVNQSKEHFLLTFECKESGGGACSVQHPQRVVVGIVDSVEYCHISRYAVRKTKSKEWLTSTWWTRPKGGGHTHWNGKP